MKLKKGDKIKIAVGKDKGRESVIEAVYPAQKKVLAAGVNLYKKHQKPKSEKDRGGVIEITKPLSVANVVLICSKCHQTTRVGFKIIEDKKTRICRKCQEET